MFKNFYSLLIKQKIFHRERWNIFPLSPIGNYYGHIHKWRQLLIGNFASPTHVITKWKSLRDCLTPPHVIQNELKSFYATSLTDQSLPRTPSLSQLHLNPLPPSKPPSKPHLNPHINTHLNPSSTQSQPNLNPISTPLSTPSNWLHFWMRSNVKVFPSSTSRSVFWGRNIFEANFWNIYEWKLVVRSDYQKFRHFPSDFFRYQKWFPSV